MIRKIDSDVKKRKSIDAECKECNANLLTYYQLIYLQLNNIYFRFNSQ